MLSFIILHIGTKWLDTFYHSNKYHVSKRQQLVKRVGDFQHLIE